MADVAAAKPLCVSRSTAGDTWVSRKRDGAVVWLPPVVEAPGRSGLRPYLGRKAYLVGQKTHSRLGTTSGTSSALEEVGRTTEAAVASVASKRKTVRPLQVHPLGILLHDVGTFTGTCCPVAELG